MGFFKRFFSEVEDPTVELMLQKLSGVGIRLGKDASTEDLFRLDWSREDIAQTGYGLLLTIMGMSSSEEHSNGSGLSPDIWYFERECAEDPHPYVSIVRRLCDLSEGEVAFDAVRDHVDFKRKEAWVEMDRNGKTERITLIVDHERADTGILQWFQEHLSASGSNKRLACHLINPSDLFICKPPETIATINEITGLNFS
jgi:hypothetical protein